MRIVGLSGSLRETSFNTALLRAAVELAPAKTTIELATISGIPVYDGDQEAREGLPAAVESLKERIAGAEGLILATPEYNASIPGAFKNAIDWLSRPPKDIGRVFGGKPTTLIGATPGGRGTWLAQTAWLPVLRALGVRFYAGGSLTVSGASSLFDEDGALTDEKTRERVEQFVHGFVAFIGA